MGKLNNYGWVMNVLIGALALNCLALLLSAVTNLKKYFGIKEYATIAALIFIAHLINWWITERRTRKKKEAAFRESHIEEIRMVLRARRDFLWDNFNDERWDTITKNIPFDVIVYSILIGMFMPVPIKFFVSNARAETMTAWIWLAVSAITALSFLFIFACLIVESVKKNLLRRKFYKLHPYYAELIKKAGK